LLEADGFIRVGWPKAPETLKSDYKIKSSRCASIFVEFTMTLRRIYFYTMLSTLQIQILGI